MNVIAIVGSTTLVDQRVRSEIRHILITEKPDLVISGGAPRVDTLAREEASDMGILFYELRPLVKAWVDETLVGFRERNRLIARACDTLYRLYDPDTTTYGSGWTADLAEELGKTVHRTELQPEEVSS